MAIRGCLLLTNYRLCFLAYLPSTAELRRAHAEQQSSSGTADKDEHPHGPHHLILKKGPSTEHRPGWAPRRRVWVELAVDSISMYPSSEQLYTPLSTVRFDDVEELHAIDWRKSTYVSFRADGKERSLEFSTEEAALIWRKEIEAALWRYRHTAEKVSVSLPLPRIKAIDQFSFLSFAACVNIVAHDEAQTSSTPVTEETPSTPSASSDDSGGSGSKDTLEVTFGLTNPSLHLRSPLEQALTKFRPIRQRLGYEHVSFLSPRPEILLDGPMTADKDGAHKDDEDEANAASSGGGEGAAENSAAVKAARENGDEVTAVRAARFIHKFSLRDDPKLRVFKANIVRTLPALGSLSIGADYLCFWRRRPTGIADTKLRIPLSDVLSAEPSRAFRWHHYGLTLHIRGHPDLYFELFSKAERADALLVLEQATAESKHAAEERDAPQPETDQHQKGAHHFRTLTHNAHQRFLASMTQHPTMSHGALNLAPKIINAQAESILRVAPMRICVSVIGSRGDVQPFIALGKGLIEQGHTVCIVSHPEYEKWVRSHGIDFRSAGGDPGALMKLAVEHRLFSPAFFRESVGKFRAWLDELLREVMEGCYDADMIIEAPQAMAGIHVAERLGVPYMRAFTVSGRVRGVYAFILGPSIHTPFRHHPDALDTHVRLPSGILGAACRHGYVVQQSVVLALRQRLLEGNVRPDQPLAQAHAWPQVDRPDQAEPERRALRLQLQRVGRAGAERLGRPHLCQRVLVP